MKKKIKIVLVFRAKVVLFFAKRRKLIVNYGN